MAVQISCRELGIQGCDFAAIGETPGDVTRAVVEHVRAKHDIDLPEADMILEGSVPEDYLESVNPGAGMIVKRLQEKLHTYQGPGPDTPFPAINRSPNE